ncbi:MAG: lytic transglycosylase domain-containing protein [Clostridia bacterium]|nr:lytic transglycosylase domain-containing protein [Clostridia bacterium]
MKRNKYLSCFLAGIISVLVILSVVKTTYKIAYPLRYEDYIEKYSMEYNLDEYLVMALIKAESNYIYDAHSGIARGLMQITDDTALWIAEKLGIEFEPEDIENPEINIRMGCYYLRYLLDYYNSNTQLALAAYNAGMGNVNKWLKNSDLCSSEGYLNSIPFYETEKYLEKIEHAQKIYKKLYENA